MNRWFVFVLLLIVPVLKVFSAADVTEADKVFMQAQDVMKEGDLKKAIELYEGMVSKFLSYEGLWTVKYNLAVAYYQTGQYAKALALFNEMAAKCPDSDMKELGALYKCNAQAALAGEEKKTENQAKLFKQAVGLFDQFLDQHKNSKYAGDALFGEAATLYQEEDLDNAEKTLSQFFREPHPNLDVEAKYLMARVYAAQARKMRDKKSPDALKQADQRLDAARKFFDEVGQNTKSLALANDAYLSAGDTFMHVEQYPFAVIYFHRIKPKEFIIDNQQQYIDSLQQDYYKAFNANNTGGAKQINDEIDRERRRLDGLKNGRNDFLAAQILISQCYYSQKKFDEILALNRHFLPHFDVDQRKNASFLMTMAWVGKKDIDHAIESYQDFQKQYPQDKLAEGIPAALAQLYFDLKNYEQSVKWAQQYLNDYPKGEYEERLLFLLASACNAWNKPDEAEKWNKTFIEKYPNSDLAGLALFTKAETEYKKKDFDKSLQDFGEYANKFPKSASAPYAAYYVAIIDYDLKKWDDAIKEFSAFEKTYPKHQLAPDSLHLLAQCYEQKKDLANANLVYDRILKELPNSEFAPPALYQKTVNLFVLKKRMEAFQSLEDFIKKFPDHDLTPVVYLCKADQIRNDKKNDEAIATYRALIEKFPNSDSAQEALVNIGNIQSSLAAFMASRPEKLTPEKQAEWKNHMAEAQKAYEEVVTKYPASTSVDKALSELSGLWQRQIMAHFVSKDEAISAFQKLAPDSNPALNIKISFTLGTLLNQLGDKEAALKTLKEAYAKAVAGDIGLPNAGYEQYRKLLFDAQQFDDALAISQRQLEDKQKEGDDKGVAEATEGIGRAFFEKDDLDKASLNFNQVVSQYAWHPSASIEAKFYLAWIEEKKKNFADALKQLNVLRASVRGANEMQVKILIRLGHCWLEKSEADAAAESVKDMNQAMGYFLGVGTGYEAFPSLAAEGLYQSGLLAEKGAVSRDAKTKFALNDAVKYYQDITREFPNTPWAAKAAERLKALGK